MHGGCMYAYIVMSVTYKTAAAAAPAGPAAPTDPADIVGSRPTEAQSNIRRHPATTKLG
jgi:hypothetical protein